jgi:hypothetical protein
MMGLVNALAVFFEESPDRDRSLGVAHHLGPSLMAESWFLYHTGS